MFLSELVRASYAPRPRWTSRVIRYAAAQEDIRGPFELPSQHQEPNGNKTAPRVRHPDNNKRRLLSVIAGTQPPPNIASIAHSTTGKDTIELHMNENQAYDEEKR